MTNLAIRGHETRSNEIIEILESLGGENTAGFTGKWMSSCVYYIDYLKKIRCRENAPSTYVTFTLEEFIEKFTYKVGDRVRIPEYESEVCISKMLWNGNEVLYELVVDDEVERYSAEELNEFNEPNKEGIMEKENNDWAKWDLPDGYEFQDKEGNVINTDVIKLVKKKLQYPKNFKECCEVLGCKANDFFTNFSYNGCDVEISEYEDKVDDLLKNFRKLRYARDAYWKIAGEQMGLGKPWKPEKAEIVYAIFYDFYNEAIDVSVFNLYDNVVLCFPTEEMRDSFLENFGHLIELCKELL